MKNGLEAAGRAVIDMETQGDDMEPDGHEGDDERTSGPSGSEMAEKDIEVKIQDKKVDTTSAAAGNADISEVKPMRIQKKHRRGSRKNRKKYKPYSKMTWDEKKARLELDAKKANKVREKYTHEKGRPNAPYNTTQFLMDEHDQEEPDIGNHAHMQSDGEAEDDDCDSRSTERRRLDSQSFDDPELGDYNESPEDEIYEQEFFQKDFTEAYEQCHAESLYSMKKDELVRECMSLEERVEALERKLREVGALDNQDRLRDSSLEDLPYRFNGDNLNTDDSSSSSNSSEDLIRTLRTELNRLKTENEKLQHSKTVQPAVCTSE
ncbi:protein HEXIM-like [Actinia tenebrosa]|uniref:Protein HEXIM-like n=1 Tax=Actinia tenebrosa TaxID=6105 RepID=A0A6P8IMJ8_ACTTE|nr:protein HEXIM-like [Actinia tenebrosa]